MVRKSAREEGEVDAGADGDEEEAEEEALEGFEVAFEFVAEFGVGEHHAREEGAEGGGEADEAHQEGDAHDDEEGEGGVHLAQARGVDIAEERPRGEDAEEDDEDDHAEGHERHAPAGQPFDEGEGVGVILGAAVDGAVGAGRDTGGRVARSGRTRSIGMTAMSCVRRTAKEERPPCVCMSFFSDSVWRTMAVEESDRIRPMARAACQGWPRARASGRERGGRARDLEAAEAEELVAHGPEGAGVELEADEEEHHHHAEFGEVAEVFGFGPDEPEERADDEPREEVAQDRAKPEAGRDGHGRHGGGEVDRGVGEEAFHRRSLQSGRGASALS